MPGGPALLGPAPSMPDLFGRGEWPQSTKMVRRFYPARLPETPAEGVYSWASLARAWCRQWEGGTWHSRRTPIT